MSLISPAGPWGEARPGCRGQITRSGGRSLDCAPRELSRSRSVMASSMSCLLPQARLPHLVSSHRAGPGARNAACHMSAIQPDMTGVCPGILDVIIIIALTLGVLTRDALSSHVSQCHVTGPHCDESFLSFFKLFPPAYSLNLSIRCPLPSTARPERRESQKFLFPLADTWLDPPTCDQASLLGSNLTPASSLSNPCVTFALRVVPGQWTVAADSEC